MAPATPIGAVIEKKYRLDEQIGQGGMGAVYRGVQLAVDRPVAIKLLHPSFTGHHKLQARFEVEARAIARLNHPNCITLFDFGYSEELAAFYTVVEFIDGVPLESLIPQRTPVARVVELVRQIASALGHAHHHGILHRDLKPENIMIAQMTDGSEMIKVLDFGIAQIMKGDDDDDFEADRLTRVGEVFGTPAYMSPEQTQSSRDLTPAADLYSLGVIFYELLEGRLPFYADLPIDILRMHISQPPPPLKRADVSPALERVVMKMLAKEPEDRPESGAKIIELLNAIPAEDLSTRSAPIRAPGDARPTEPTIIDAPDTDLELSAPEREVRSTPTIHTPPEDEIPFGERSVILELTDIVPDSEIADGILASPPPGHHKSSATATAASHTPSSASPEQGPVKRTMILETSSSDDLYYSSLRRAQHTRNLLLFFFLLLLFSGGVALVYLVRGAADEASSDSFNINSIDLRHNDSPEHFSSPQHAPPHPQAPREVSIRNEESTPDSTDNEAGQPPKLSSPPPTRPTNRRAPRQNAQQESTPDRSRPARRSEPKNLRLHDDVPPEDEPRRPARLGL